MSSVVKIARRKFKDGTGETDVHYEDGSVVRKYTRKDGKVINKKKFNSITELNAE